MENTTERKFKRGDLVTLKSGGAVMVVEGYQADLETFGRLDDSLAGIISCVWQSYSTRNKSYTPSHARYHEDLLERTTKKPEV